MEETLQPLEADQQIKLNKLLVLGIAASVILHLVCTVALFSLPQGPQTTPPSVTYIDLNAPQHSAPMAVPPKEMVPQKVVQQAEPPLAPEILPQAQQPTTALPEQPAAPQQTKVEEERSHTTIGLGLTKGYFKALGEGETLRAGIKEYYMEMLQQINEKWWMDEQLDKRRIAPIVVSITVARNGAIINSQIMKGSGDSRYDRAVLASLAMASPLPPLPSSYQGDFFQAPIRLVPPLNLMAW
jgi:periplasmic protein TonB